MTERGVVLAALCVAVAAFMAIAAPWWVVGMVVLGALVVRRPVVVVVALVIVTSSLAARAEAGLSVVPHRVAGIATVVADPEARPGGVVIEVRLAGRRYRSFAAGTVGAGLRDVRVGNELIVSGRVGALSGPWAWRASRHLSGRLDIGSARIVGPGRWWWQSANWVHSTIEAGLGSFEPSERALFLGVVLGDDRGQSDVDTFRFRASGLSHLTAVSGQNVAFMLVAASPVLRRLRLGWRWGVTLVVLAWFALATRLEPSVLRAVGMAAVACTASWWGRYASGVRVLSVAVVGLLVVDPMLVWSLGFRLSVAASAALVTLARPLARSFGRVVPGSRWVAEALAVTVAAQVGTAPMLLGLSGTVPALGPLLNVVAVPVAGWLMVWGIVTGPLAGLAGEPLASWLGWPSRWAVRWLGWVAGVGADPGLPRVAWIGVGGTVAAVLAAVVGEWTAERAWGLRLRPVLRTVLAVGVLLVPVDVITATFTPTRARFVVQNGSSGHDSAPQNGWAGVWSDGGVVMSIGARTTSEAALGLLLQARVGRVDVLIVTGGGRSSAAVVWDLRQVVDVGVVLAPDPSQIRDAQRLWPGTVVAGRVRVVVGREGRGWRVSVGS